jgi:hypothetical protein
MGRRKSRIATGLNIEERAEKMRKTILGIDTGGKRWEEQTAKGTRFWTYWMKIVIPYINGVSTMYNLTPEQRMIAVKETLKVIAENLEDYLLTCAYRGVETARRLIPVVARSPPVVYNPELLV